ncbi:MAG: hypothetical protein ABI811_24075 [Acidobacteriota bacterium]
MADENSNVQALMDELAEERRKREGLEHRVNELASENARSRAVAEEAERSSSIRGELQKLGVAKVELAYKAVRDELKSSTGEQIREYLTQFVGENPELMPARIAGGSGAGSTRRGQAGGGPVDIESIRPGMSSEEMERVRQEIARVALQTLRGNL